MIFLSVFIRPFRVIRGPIALRLISDQHREALGADDLGTVDVKPLNGVAESLLGLVRLHIDDLLDITARHRVAGHDLVLGTGGVWDVI